MKLRSLCELCGADEVVLFEKTTFLVISHATAPSDAGLVAIQSEASSSNSEAASSLKEKSGIESTSIPDSTSNSSLTTGLPRLSSATMPRKKRDLHRFEKVSNTIKQFKLSCHASQGNFQCLEIRNSTFSALVDHFTDSTYIMIIVANPDTVLPAAVSININAARPYFEKLLA